MKDNHVFIDTNILIYAHDRTAGAKWKKARAFVIEQWKRKNAPSISVQVLQELYVNLLKKQIAPKIAKELIADYCQWNVIANDETLLMLGIEEQEKWKLSYWDALIIAAARRSGASVLWSEDFNTGQDFDGITAINPLALD